jgi:hypothetical protein
MTAEERKIKIKEISEGVPVATGTKLKYQGEIREFNVYKIPLEFLAYNVGNGRISSLVKSYKREHGDLDMTRDSDSYKVAQFLFESSEDRNKKTMRDLAQNGQMEPGIITMDGVIVDGNRRASLLRRITESREFDQTIKDKCSYFLARILPEDADEKEILRLETSYQMGADSKVDYNPIEKYLHTRDMRDKSFSIDQIAEYMGLSSSKEVLLNLEIMELIDSYLDTYGYNGIYTRLPRGCEDDFLKLNTAIKKIRGGKISWIQSDELDEVENDLRVICFDYIRLEEKGDFDFRMLASTASSNFLSDEKTWRSFVKSYYEEQTEDAESADDVLNRATNDEEAKRLLNQRDNQWKNNVREHMMDSFRDCKNQLENKKEKSKPLALLKKAINALSEIDKESLSSVTNKEELLAKTSEIRTLIQGIETSLSE